MEHAFRGSNKLEFGSELVFIVRDNRYKGELACLIGTQAIILNVLEIKGLEFEDIVLYDFFRSSPMKDWRVVYNYFSQAYNCPKFNSFKHHMLSSELKQLYVAVTRARQRLWLLESTEASKPMFDLWRGKCVVEVRELNDTLVRAMQSKSSPEEWTSRGVKLYEELNFEMASLCFEKAGNEKYEKKSKAHAFKAIAERVRMSNPEEADLYLKKSAQLLEEVEKIECSGEENVLGSNEVASITNDLDSVKFVDEPDCNNQELPIDLVEFGIFCDAIVSLGNETEKIQMITEEVDRYFKLLEGIYGDVCAKYERVMSHRKNLSYVLFLRYRIEVVQKGLKGIGVSLASNEVERCKELFEKTNMKRLMETVHKDLIRFLNEYNNISAMTQGASEKREKSNKSKRTNKGKRKKK